MADTGEQGRLNRRALLKQAGILGLGLPAAAMLVNACSSNDSTHTPNPSGLVVSPPAGSNTGATGAATTAGGHDMGNTAAAPEAVALTIRALDTMKFEPAELSAAVGQKVTLTFHNAGVVEHDFQAEKMPVSDFTVVSQPNGFNDRMNGILRTAMADPHPFAGGMAGEEMVIEFVPTTEGQFEFICSVPGHYQAGMKGVFNVAAAGTAVATQVTGAPTAVSADEMDRLHAVGVQMFPAETEGVGGVPLEYTMDGDVKVFELECDVIQWEVEVGKKYEAWAYNKMVPGPEIRVTEGDKVRFNVKNNLPQSTAIHWHGLFVPHAMDGVPYITQDPIKPGTTFTYEFQVQEGNHGSHMYHSHHNAAFQVTMGLLGAFIVEPKDPADRPAFDREYTMILNDGPLGGFSINGKGFPATAPLVAKKGEKVLVRYMNEGLMIHPMHLHGMPQLVVARDGWVLPQPYMCDTVNIAPGERWDVIIDATEVGVWAYHCHILSHAESEHGMFGMVTVLIVEE